MPELFSCLPKGPVACVASVSNRIIARKLERGTQLGSQLTCDQAFFFFFQGISAAWKKCGTGLEIIFLCPVGLACLVWLAKWTTDTWCCRFLYMKWFTIPWKFFNSLDEIPHLIITFEIPFLPDWRYQTTLLFERAGQVFWYQWCGRNKTTRHKCNTFCTIFQKAVFKK